MKQPWSVFVLGVVACACGAEAEEPAGRQGVAPEGDPAVSVDAVPVDAVQGPVGLGDSGPEVLGVFEYLRVHGYFPDAELAARYPSWEPVVHALPEDPRVFGAVHAEAVAAFQERGGLAVSGVVDDATLEHMQRPGCSNPEHELVALDPTEKFAQNGNRWDKTSLTYKITRYPNDPVSEPTVNAAVARAFATWSATSTLDFTRITSGTADIQIGWFVDGAYPSGWPNPNGGVACADKTHISLADVFDWSGTFVDIESFILHEAGHSIGLSHSTVTDAGEPVMYYSQTAGQTRRALFADDKIGIGSMYNVWKNVPGVGVDIGAGGSAASPSVWVTSDQNSIFKLNVSANTWDWVPGDGVSVAVTPAGIPWVVTSTNQIYDRTSSSATTGIWTLRGTARDVAAGGSQIWAVTTTASGSNFKLARWTGSAWEASDGIGTRVAVDKTGRVWTVRADRTVFRRTIATGSNGSWENLGGCARDIGAGADGSVWAIGCTLVENADYGVLLWNEQVAQGGNAPARKLWLAVDGHAARISGSPDGRPWAVQSSKNIFRRAPR